MSRNEQFFETLRIDAQLRAENLGVNEFASMVNYLLTRQAGQQKTGSGLREHDSVFLAPTATHAYCISITFLK